jgi:hypothetical protein
MIFSSIIGRHRCPIVDYRCQRESKSEKSRQSVAGAAAVRAGGRGNTFGSDRRFREDTPVRFVIDVCVLFGCVGEGVSGVAVAGDTSGPDLLEAVESGTDTTPVESGLVRNGHLVWGVVACLGREYRGVDVPGELVVVDEDADTRVCWRSCSQHVESEMERTVLGDVVVGRLVGHREPGDALAVSGFDDDAETATGVSERTICGEIEVPVVGPRGMRDVWRRRLVEQVS